MKKNLLYRGERVAYTVKKIGDYRERRVYSKTKNAIELKDLLEIQKKSYDWFMTEGIKEVFDDIFPVESFTGNLSLEFGEYSFDQPRYTIKGCKERYATYAAPLKVEARLFNHETGEVMIEVKPTKELYQCLLSFGADMQVISPDSVRQKMQQEIAGMLENYNV